jgi:hypothetical protein
MSDNNKETIYAHKIKIIDCLLHLFYIIEKKNICKINNFRSIHNVNSKNSLCKIKRKLSNQLLNLYIYDE